MEKPPLSFDVCIVCALPEEARAFLEVAQQHCEDTLEERSSPRYQFWTLAPGSTTWTIAQAYSSTASFSWNTTGKVAGTYHYTVWARESASTGSSCCRKGTARPRSA